MGEKMYAAMLNNKLVLAIEEEQIINLGNKKINSERYICPHCQKRVILVISEKKQAFFKHVTKIDNLQGEKDEHRTSKSLLKSAFTAAGFNARMEVPLLEGQLRADVLVSDKLSLEVQCAPLSDKEYQHRHKLYLDAGILDLWIVGKRHYLKKRLKKTQLIFFRENQLWGLYYLEIDPFHEYLRLKYNIMLEPVTSNLKYQTKIFKLDEVGIRKLWKFKPYKKKYTLKPKKQKTYIHKQILQKTNLGLKIAEQLYKHHLTLDQIPDQVFEKWRKPTEKNKLLQYLDKLN